MQNLQCLFGVVYQSAFGRNEYQEAKDKYDESAQNKKRAEIKAKKLVEELKDMLDQVNGKTYQVQWSQNPDKRMVIPIK